MQKSLIRSKPFCLACLFCRSEQNSCSALILPNTWTFYLSWGWQCCMAFLFQEGIWRVNILTLLLLKQNVLTEPQQGCGFLRKPFFGVEAQVHCNFRNLERAVSYQRLHDNDQWISTMVPARQSYLIKSVRLHWKMSRAIVRKMNDLFPFRAEAFLMGL